MTCKEMKNYMVQNYGLENRGTIEFFGFCQEKHSYELVSLWFERCKLVAEEGYNKEG